MKKLMFLFVPMMILILSSCERNESSTQLKFPSMEFNMLCGWCVLGEQLSFDGKDNTVTYEIINPCDPDNPVESEERALTTDEIQAINDLYDEAQLLDIAIAQCGECYDGCEERLIINTELDIIHMLQFDSITYQELDPIEDLILELRKIRDTF